MPYLVQNRSPWFQSWVHLAASHCNHTPLGSQATTTHCNHTPPPDRQSQPGGMELRRLGRLEEKGVEEEEEGEAGSEQEKQEPHLKNTWLLAQFGVHRSDLVGDLCRRVVLLLDTSAGRELETTG